MPPRAPDEEHHLHWLIGQWGGDAKRRIADYRALERFLEEHPELKADLEAYCFVTGSALTGAPAAELVNYRNGLRDCVRRILNIAAIDPLIVDRLLADPPKRRKTSDG